MNQKTTVIIGIIIFLIVIAVARILIAFGAIGIFALGVFLAKPEVYDDVINYKEYMSFSDDGSESRWTKWGMDESIWPASINDDSQVAEFKMIYYNPWDAQYLGYLVMDYEGDDYNAEVKRLKEYDSTEYIGYYSVVEETTFELLAVNADEYNGFVYALTDGKNRIIYAEQIFCNYYMDLDYKAYIPEEYLLDGFDATSDNPYRKKMLKEK
jgi:hypothetical protein